MTAWVLKDKEIELGLHDINKQPDRIVGIILGALLDERLDSAIKSRLVYHKVYTEQMFREGGPIGSLSTRIQLGHLLGVYGEATLKDLIIIKDIRNRFAHWREGVSFKTDYIAAWCQNMTIIERRTYWHEHNDWHIVYQREYPNPTLKDRFIYSTSVLLLMLYAEVVEFSPMGPFVAPRF
jgi:hypothetical protein